MANAPTLDFNAFVTRRKAERADGAMENEHDYSYVLDRQTRSTFESAKPIELAVVEHGPGLQGARARAAARQRRQGLEPAVLRASTRIAKDCAETLGIVPPSSSS